MHLVAPFYLYPGSGPQWDQLIASAPALSSVVLNPNSGPGDNLSEDWLRVAKACQLRGIKTYGYVHTREVPDRFGNRDISAVLLEAGKHFCWYGVDGLFLDEASTRLEDLDYFRQFNCKTILNCGTIPDEGYVNISGCVCVFEGTPDQHAKFVAPDWIAKYPKQRFYSIVHDVPDVPTMQSILKKARTFADNVWITNGSGDNPYGQLPGYWAELVKAVKQLQK